MRARGLNEIVSNLIDNIKDKIPSVDSKEGTFIRDVFIDPVAQQLAELYQDLMLVERSQSVDTATGEDLDKLASNYFIARKEGTKSRGTLRFYVKTVRNIQNNIPVGDFILPNLDFILPSGTIVNTQPDKLNESLYFSTIESFSYYTQKKPTNLNFDSRAQMYYFDVEAESIAEGENNNVDSFKINQIQSVVSDFIFSVTNVYPFLGGTESESDTSLITRIGLALTGANVGTKKGYRSLLLSQPDVKEVMVVGAGDSLMRRDLRKNDRGEIIQPNIHEGGKVDLYVNTNQYQDLIYSFTYLGESKNVLPSQPVKSIKSLIQKNTDGSVSKVFLNKSDCEFEKISSGTNTEKTFYYIDVEWNFQNRIGTTNEDININTINSSLLKNASSLQEIPFVFGYVDVSREEDFKTGDDIFHYGDSFRSIYKLQTVDIEDPDSPFINIKDENNVEFPLKFYTFVKKNGKIYHRKYVKPDYQLSFDTDDERYGSYKAQDAIEWITQTRPSNNSTLVIQYESLNHIQDLQETVDENKVITADVLVKRAKPVPTIINIQVVPYLEYDFETITTLTISRIQNYMEAFQGMGSELDLSNLVTISRISEGVQFVGLDNSFIMTLSDSGNWNVKRTIKLKDNEYFDLKNIYVSVITKEDFVEVDDEF